MMTTQLSKTKNQQKSGQKGPAKLSYSLDTAMLQSWHCLVVDLLGINPSLQNSLLKTKTGAEIRSADYPGIENSSPYIFKVYRQLADYHKRYIFADDLLSLEELERKTEKEFISSQETFGLPDNLPYYSREVLERARCIIYDIVGEFDFLFFADCCKFGKLAALGVPRREASIPKKMEILSYSSDDQLRLFNCIKAGDSILTEAVTDKPCYIPAIIYHSVPKTYKINRGIAPPSVVEGFLSQGLGVYLRMLLEERTHINLATAKSTHMRAARDGSKNGNVATIDMSNASNSFVWEHVKQLFPRSWWYVLDIVRTRLIEINHEVYELKSYMLMGSGHTFPMQTIMFYALAEAVRQLSNSRGKTLTFGDDIILPTRCASIFCRIMTSLGFTINKEKSFISRVGKFRESCGGDYYLGFDVRPVMPKGTFEPMGMVEFCANIYKILNRLLATWDFYEIPSTVAYLYSLIKSELGFVARGDRLTQSEFSSLLYDIPFELVHPVILMDKGKRALQGPLIQVIVSRRGFKDQELPFYWDKLRSMHREVDDIFNPYDIPPVIGETLESYLEKLRVLAKRPLSEEEHMAMCRELFLLKKVDFRHKPRYKLKVTTVPFLGTRIN